MVACEGAKGQKFRRELDVSYRQFLRKQKASVRDFSLQQPFARLSLLLSMKLKRYFSLLNEGMVKVQVFLIQTLFLCQKLKIDLAVTKYSFIKFDVVLIILNTD